MRKGEVLTLYFQTAGTVDIYRDTAAILGYVTTSGKMMGEGSPSQLFTALLNGEVDPKELNHVVVSVKARMYTKLNTEGELP